MNQEIFQSQVSPKAPPWPKNPTLAILGSGQHHCWHFLGACQKEIDFLPPVVWKILSAAPGRFGAELGDREAD